MAREKVDNKLNVVIGTKAQIEGDTGIPENSIIIVTDEELEADEVVYSVEKNIKEAIEDLEGQVALKVNTSDIVDNLNSNDTDKPLSANQGKVLNDTTAKLAVSNVFTQPQQVPNATLPQHTVNKLQVETMFEMFKRGLRGYNLAGPDLTGKEHLGNGEYKLVNISGVDIFYNVYNGIFTFNDVSGGNTFTPFLFFNPLFGSHSFASYYVSGTVSNNFRFYFREPSFTFITLVNGRNIFLNDLMFTGQTELVFNTDSTEPITFDNYKIKIQLEKGSIATPYTVPGQIPQYKIVGEE